MPKHKIQLELMDMDLTQMWLVKRVREDYGEKIDPTALSCYLLGRVSSQKSQRVLHECEEIIKRERQNRTERKET